MKLCGVQRAGVRTGALSRGILILLCGVGVGAWLPGCRRTAGPSAAAAPDGDRPAATVQQAAAAASTPEAEALKQEAVEAADRLARQYPDDPNAIYMLALVHDEHGDRARAENCWKKCLELDRRFVRASYCLGKSALERGEYAESVGWLRRALEVDPQLSDAHFLLGKALMGQGHMREAAAPLEQHLRLSPRSSEGCFVLGQVYFHLGEYEKARQHYQAALAADPDGPLAYRACYGLATACRRLGEEEPAGQYLEQFRTLRGRHEQMVKDRYREQDDALAVRKSAAYLLSGVSIVYARHGNLEEAERLRSRVAALGSGERQPAGPAFPSSAADRHAGQGPPGDIEGPAGASGVSPSEPGGEAEPRDSAFSGGAWEQGESADER